MNPGGAGVSRNVGELQHNAVLTDNDVRLIRKLGEHRKALMLERARINKRKKEITKELRRISLKQLASKFEVTMSTIGNVLSNRGWRHVKNDG